jgi:hypothetical protein
VQTGVFGERSELREVQGVYVIRLVTHNPVFVLAPDRSIWRAGGTIVLIALIALAVVMLIWALVTWDEPVEKPPAERQRHV